MYVLGCILKFIPLFWFEIHILFHGSWDRVTLYHAKLVQELSNLIILVDEYLLWIMDIFNPQAIVKTSQICHLKSFLQLFIYGYSVASIVPCHQQIIYLHYKIYIRSSNFIYKQCSIIKIKLFETQFQKMHG